MREEVDRVRRADFRRVQRLVAECRALGDDSHEWRRHALMTLMEMLGAKAAIGNEMADLKALSDLKWRGVPKGAPVRAGAAGPIRIGFNNA